MITRTLKTLGLMKETTPWALAYSILVTIHVKHHLNKLTAATGGWLRRTN